SRSPTRTTPGCGGWNWRCERRRNARRGTAARVHVSYASVETLSRPSPMKSVARLALALLVACVAALPSLAQERRGFMWEARKGEHRVYLVGTIHVGKPDFHQQPADVLARYGE